MRADPPPRREIAAYADDLRRTYGGGSSAEVPGAADARELYKALGLDPTKTRPSNEALLRRVLKGEALYRVNTLVDALNLASLRRSSPSGSTTPPASARRCCCAAAAKARATRASARRA